MELRSEMLRKKKGLVNMHEERNFHLTTVGGLSTIMSLASSGIGMWLLATDSRIAGTVLMVTGLLFLRLAYESFRKIREKPDWCEYHVKD